MNIVERGFPPVTPKAPRQAIQKHTPQAHCNLTP